MKVFLKISQYLNPYNGFAFDSKWQNTEALKDFYFFEIDNHSDKYLVQQVVKLIEENEAIVILFEMQADTVVGNIPFLLRKILRYKKKVIIIYNGEHHQINKIITPFFCIKKDFEITKEYLNKLISNREVQ